MTSDGADRYLSIGELARASGLTPKALRHYDRIGLLRPATVDPDTGYRRYTEAQVVDARTIGRLRAVDLSLDDVRSYLSGGDAVRSDILRTHRRRLESRTARLHGALHAVDHLIKEGSTMSFGQELTSVALLQPDDERRLAVDLFNEVWRLMEKEDRSTADEDRMLHMAHASRYHWEQVGQAEHLARGEWQCSRVYAVLGRSEPSLHHALRDLTLCLENSIADWDLAFAYEAVARAHAVAGSMSEARAATEQALLAAEDIADAEDRELVLSDLETIPGQPRFW